MVVPAAVAALYLGGAIVQGLGSVQSGNAASSLADYNARVARLRARDAIDIAKLDIADLRRGVAQLIGSQRVAAVANGLMADVGSPVSIAEDTAYVSNIDEQRIMLNAMRERWGLLTQADDFDESAKQAHKSGTAGAIGSVLGGAADAFGSFTK